MRLWRIRQKSSFEKVEGGARAMAASESSSCSTESSGVLETVHTVTVALHEEREQSTKWRTKGLVMSFEEEMCQASKSLLKLKEAHFSRIMVINVVCAVSLLMLGLATHLNENSRVLVVLSLVFSFGKAWLTTSQTEHRKTKSEILEELRWVVQGRKRLIMSKLNSSSMMSTTSTILDSEPETIDEDETDENEPEMEVEVLRNDLAQNGNGFNEPLSEDELQMIEDLHQAVQDDVIKLVECNPREEKFCDFETCRRYLVARNWKLQKAEAQLRATLKWRLQENPGAKKFEDSKIARRNPWGLSMRLIGFSEDGRPIVYTNYTHANERWNADGNIDHVQRLMEASSEVLFQRRNEGLNPSAASRQCIWVVDFDGFCIRDSSPRSAILTAHLMAHYPEMLSQVVLLNSPALFSGTFRAVSVVLDDRTRSKVVFISKNSMQKLHSLIGQEATDWIIAETAENKETQSLFKRCPEKSKSYWIAPDPASGKHDARGMMSYVNSHYYFRTPGDGFQSDQQES